MQPAWKGQESTLDERPQAPEVPAEIQMPPRSYCLGSKSQPENGMTVYQAFFFLSIFFFPSFFQTYHVDFRDLVNAGDVDAHSHCDRVT